MNVQEELHKHFKEDKENFAKINDNFESQNIILAQQDKDHIQFKEDLDEIKAFMKDLKGVDDFFRGVGLLKKPAMIFVAVVVGIVALFGGLKTIIGWFVAK